MLCKLLEQSEIIHELCKWGPEGPCRYVDKEMSFRAAADDDDAIIDAPTSRILLSSPETIF